MGRGLGREATGKMAERLLRWGRGRALGKPSILLTFTSCFHCARDNRNY